MSDRTAKAITAVTLAVAVTVGVLTARTVTEKQLDAMEQCAPNCQLGAPLMSPPELAGAVLLVVTVVLVASSLASGWPFGGQFR